MEAKHLQNFLNKPRIHVWALDGDSRELTEGMYTRLGFGRRFKRTTCERYIYTFGFLVRGRGMGCVKRTT